MAELVVLQAFLDAYEHEPWTPGEKIDCCLIIAEWLIWLGCDDPVPDIRGTYKAGQGQIDVLAKHGGAVELIKHGALAVGAVPAANPQCGDFGVIGSATNITRQFGVIHDGRGWLTRAPDGFKRLSGKTLSIWRL